MESTQIWWSVRPHHSFGTVEIRICDGQTEMGDALAVAALAMACVAAFARDHDAGRPLPAHPRGLIDENIWRAQRHGLEGGLIDLDRGLVRPTTAAIGELLAWSAPVHEPLGLTPFLAGVDRMLAEGNGAMRQQSRLAAPRRRRDGPPGRDRRPHPPLRRRGAGADRGGDGMTEPGAPPVPPEPGAPREPTGADLAAALAERLAHTPVRDVLLQAMATFIDMAGIRLGMGPSGDAPRDLTQARQSIEALRALLGVAERELGAAQVRPFKEPLAVLQMAYARAVEQGPPGEAPAGRRGGTDRRSAAAAPASARPGPGAAALGAAGHAAGWRPRLTPSGSVW